jgi:hypothetical protein
MGRIKLELDVSARLLPPWQEGVRGASPWIFIRAGGQPSVALLDTGAAWSIVRRELALAAGLPLEGLTAVLSTRLGRRSGCSSPRSRSRSSVSRGGMLERVCFALAPMDASTPARLYMTFPGVSFG